MLRCTLLAIAIQIAYIAGLGAAARGIEAPGGRRGSCFRQLDNEPAAPSSPYRSPEAAADAAEPEPLARQLPPPDPRQRRERPRGSVAPGVEIVCVR